MRFVGAACAILWAATFAAASPALAFSQAHADLAKLPAETRLRCRYLSLHNLPLATRENAYQVLCGHVNGLSRESDITPLAIVPGTAGGLLRLDIDSYRWKRQTWEDLAEADPYFHVKIVITEDWPGGVWHEDGKHYPAGAFRTKLPAKLALAPWVAETDAERTCLAQTILWTQSQAPVVRGDWFFNQTAAQVGRDPGYYDFLQVFDKAGFQALGGFDRKIAEKFRVELREAVSDSGVTLQPRAIARYDSPGGAYWFSIDFRKAVDKRNPLRVLGAEIENEADAFEEYISLPNGLWATGLFNLKGDRQDTAPDFIASDSHAKRLDRRVHVNVSCIRCHVDGGLQSIDGWARNLYQPPLALQSADYKKYRELKQQYLRKLEPFLERDKKLYAEAIKECTGLEPKAFAKAYGEFWEAYEDARIDLAYAAQDLGCKPEVFVSSLKSSHKLSGQIDPVLSIFLLDGARKKTIGIRQWEEAYPLAQTIIRGVSP